MSVLISIVLTLIATFALIEYPAHTLFATMAGLIFTLIYNIVKEVR